MALSAVLGLCYYLPVTSLWTDKRKPGGAFCQSWQCEGVPGVERGWGASSWQQQGHSVSQCITVEPEAAGPGRPPLPPGRPPTPRECLKSSLEMSVSANNSPPVTAHEPMECH